MSEDSSTTSTTSTPTPDLSDPTNQNLFQHLQHNPESFEYATGINIHVFNNVLLPFVAPVVHSRRNHLGPSQRLSVEDEVVMLLRFLRSGATYKEVALLYGLSEPTVRQSIKLNVTEFSEISSLLVYWVPLEQMYQRIIDDKYPQFNNVCGIIDATEVRINKPKVNQQKYYSGKKKCHTIKFHIVVQPITGLIMYVGTVHAGSRHDFRMFEKSKVMDMVGDNEALMGDRGYVGMDKYINATVPFKRVGRVALSVDDYTFNSRSSSHRMIVEHVIGRMKNFKILKKKWQGKLNNLEFLDKVVLLVAELVNLVLLSN